VHNGEATLARCLDAIESNTIEHIAAVDAELLLAVSAFHLGVYQHLVQRLGVYWLAYEDWQRLELLRRLYRDRREAPSAGEEHRLASLQITIGSTLEQIGLIGELQKALEGEHGDGGLGHLPNTRWPGLRFRTD